MSKLILRNLRKAYGSYIAVEGLDLTIDKGETVALLGPSGCGKSTTLNMIVGLTSPTSGEIEIDGRQVAHLPPGQRGIGLVFQDYAVFGNMSVRDNIAFGLKVRRYDRARIKGEVEAVAKLVGLSDALDAPTAGMGGSLLQRVALARTLVTNPSILLLDEPLSNLEAAMRNQMRRELRRIQQETGQTVIYVTHDQIEALSLAHKIAVMSKGRLVHFADAHSVYHHPRETFVGSFLGNPPMNFLRGTLVQGKDGPHFDTGALNIALAAVEAAHGIEHDTHLQLGIRPENLRLGDGPEAVPGEVTLCERLGADQVLTVNCAGSEIRVLTEGAASHAPGERVSLVFPPEAISLFDGESGVRFSPSHPLH